jgi:hypothetical protein
MISKADEPTTTPPPTKTPRSRKRYADHSKEWEDLTASMAANAAEVPHLEAQRVSLEKMLAEFRDLTLQQAAFQANKQKVSQRLQAVVDQGQKLATVLRVSLKQHYGRRSEDLVKFGMQPFRGFTRKPSPAPEPEKPPATEPPASSTPSI